MYILLLVTFLALLDTLVLGYDEKYDKQDVDKIIADDALFGAYVDCLLDKGPCTLEYSQDFKVLFPEIVSTACAKCTPIQKTNIRKCVNHMIKNRPADFLKFQSLYDPKLQNMKPFMAFMVDPN